jgi:hypothetical protein
VVNLNLLFNGSIIEIPDRISIAIRVMWLGVPGRERGRRAVELQQQPDYVAGFSCRQDVAYFLPLPCVTAVSSRHGNLNNIGRRLYHWLKWHTGV